MSMTTSDTLPSIGCRVASVRWELPVIIWIAYWPEPCFSTQEYVLKQDLGVKCLKTSVVIIITLNDQFGFKAERKRKYHRESRMSKAEIMVIMILFHSSGYCCLKHFYLEKVCKHMRHLFPEVVSYNRWSSESRSQTCLDYAEISCKREQSQACLAMPSAADIQRS